MAFLKGSISSAPQATKETAYKTFVRPTLEYANTTWTPHAENETHKLEIYGFSEEWQDSSSAITSAQVVGSTHARLAIFFHGE